MSESQVVTKPDRDCDMSSEENAHQTIAGDLFAYWSHIRGNHAAPRWVDIHPGDIPHILADAFMIELDAVEDFPLQHCGARLDALWLKRQKGSPFLDFWRANSQRDIAAGLLTVSDATTPFAGVARARAPGHPEIEMELLLLPLRKTGVAPARVFGALTPNYQPPWFGQARAEPLDLVSLRVVSSQTFNVELYKQSAFRRVPPPPSRPTFVVHEGGKR